MTSVSVQKDLLASGSTDKLAQVWNLRTKTKLWQFQHEDTVQCVQLHGNWLITCSHDESTRIWDLGKGKQIHRLEQSGRCQNSDISPNKSLLAIACRNELVLWDILKSRTIEYFNLGPMLCDVRFNPSGTRIIVGLLDGEVFKIDLVSDAKNEEDVYDMYGLDRSPSQMSSNSETKTKRRFKLVRKMFKKCSN